MIKISGIVIAKNAENVIADCLESISFCDETIVVDNGSEDRTVEVAKRMNAKVFTFLGCDFSGLRNFGLHKAKGEWILYVDADERVTPSLRDEIKHQISNIINQNIVAFKIKRKNFYFGTSAKNEWPHIERNERLFRKNFLKEWKGILHESPIIVGEIGELDGYLLHYTHSDLYSMLEKTIEWSKLEADLRFKSNHPKITWWRFPRVMLTAFLDSYIYQQGWRVGVIGLIESMYQAFSIFVTYARLWEMQQNIKIKNEK